MSSDNKAPIQSFRDGGISIHLWERTHNDKPVVAASINKSYRDQSGEWRDSRSLSPTDLLRLQAMLPQVREEIGKWQQYYRQQTQEHEHAEVAPRDMVAERDAAMQAASSRQQGNTQEHARAKSKTRER